MFQVLDEMSELIYIADMKTYELLYMNHAGKEMFQVNGEVKGKCYQILQGREAPCEFCTNCRLQESSFYSWEKTNPLLGRHFLLKDKLIDWEGKKARVEIAFDMTEQEMRRRTIQEALEIQSLVTECAKRLYEADENPGVLDDVLRVAGEYLQADRVYVFEFQADRMSNTHEWCGTGVEAQIKKLQNMPLALIQSWRKPFAEQKYFAVEDLEEIRETGPEEYAVLAAQKIHSIVAVPLLFAGRLIGYVGTDNFLSHRKDNTIELLKAIGYFISAMLRQQRTLAQLEKLSYYDSLTGIRNRNAYEKKLKEPFALPMGVVYLNINGMKQINDQHGHKSGDAVLGHTAQVLSSYFKEENCYRIGSDEFLVFGEGTSRTQFLEKEKKLRNHFTFHEDYFVSMGVCFSEETQPLRELVFQAAEKMFQDKKAFYRGHALTGRYRSRTDDILGVTDPEALEKMLKAGQFLVYYQPQIEIGEQKLCGAEALVRYRDANGKFYAPDQFIPLLEEARLISKVDFFVFESVCVQLREWRREGLPAVPVSTNFSRHTLAVENFAGRLQEICRHYEVPQELLVVEITETVEADDKALFFRTMEQLGEKKFRIAIDDFGVNNANLSLLTEVEFHILKIDKRVIDHLVQSEKTRLLLDALVKICRQMQIRLIAEGVETEEQLEELRKMECDMVQGYLFGKPAPLEEFQKLF